MKLHAAARLSCIDFCARAHTQSNELSGKLNRPRAQFKRIQTSRSNWLFDLFDPIGFAKSIVFATRACSLAANGAKTTL